MNKFTKYCPNVWIAECQEPHNKGDIIELETKYGKEIECQVFNLVLQKGDKYYYSIIRMEDMTYAQRKAERYNNSATNHQNKSNAYYEASQEGREFLALGEPIKIGHHSENRHRALIERNRNRMDKSMEELKIVEKAQHKAEYWESKAEEITLAMPESIEYFTLLLEQAQEHQKDLKSGVIQKTHSYSLTYATKNVKELNKKVEIANKLWG